jgi:hypothetical protein
MVLDLGRGSRRRYVLQQGDNCTTRVGTRVEVGGGWRVVAIAIDVGSMSEVMVPPPAARQPLCRRDRKLVQKIFVSFGSMRF